jgi:hypothetical protein
MKLHSTNTILMLALATILGCKAAPPPTISQGATLPTPTSTIQAPFRPSNPPPPFKLFHQTENTITLVTKEDATDADIAALIYQLHDAARAHSFDALHIPQKLIDARDPYIWFHIYRGPKCAAEKYAPGAPPCGGSYHAAGDYTLGSFSNPDRDDGLLDHHDPESQTQLWNPDTPTSP